MLRASRDYFIGSAKAGSEASAPVTLRAAVRKEVSYADPISPHDLYVL